MTQERPVDETSLGIPSWLAGAARIRTECFLNGDPPCSTDTLRQVYHYWHSKRRPGRLPGRRDIDPLDLNGLLPCLELIDVLQVDGRRRFRFRLMGEGHVTVMGLNATGRFVDQVPEIIRDHCGIIDRYEAVCDRRQAHYWMRSFVDRSKSWRYYERVLMPLAADGETVDMLFGVLAMLGSD